MKKNLIYGVITVCIASILAIGGFMSMPEADPVESAGTHSSSEPSVPVSTAPSHTTVETTLPAQTQMTEPSIPPQTQPTESLTQPTEPTTKPTEPLTQPTEPATKPTEVQTATLVFVDWPNTIAGGETGKVTIQGKPNTTYAIKVYYKSGPSGAKGLEEKVSDADGFVTWTWKVSKNTKPGDFKIVVTGGGETVEVPFTVLD